VVLQSAGIPVRVALDAGFAVTDTVAGRNPFNGNTYLPGRAENAAAAIAQYKIVSADQAKVIEQAECAAQTTLLRDIIGNPFRPVAINPAWLTWNGGTVPKVAQAIYDERAFDRMPVLADALEDAGCSDAAVLNHCRQPGVHVRGCWVVDLLLGKG